MVRYVMVIDLRRCVGCDTCTVACRVENFTPKGILWCKVEKIEIGKYPNANLLPIPMHCMHCANPPCVKICPTGASYKREDGIVLIDYDKCMGCRACVVACPYNQRYYVEEIKEYYNGKGFTPYEEIRETLEGAKKHKKGITEKCTFCVDRVDKGEKPFCVETCIADAIFFGDLDDPQSEAARLIASRGGFQLRRELGTDPSVYYLPP
jgi:molybdopterin-containing oxidoreductase family iron-sulfur binding subunit